MPASETVYITIHVEVMLTTNVKCAVYQEKKECSSSPKKLKKVASIERRRRRINM